MAFGVLCGLPLSVTGNCGGFGIVFSGISGRAGGAHRPEDGAPGGPADGLRALPARFLNKRAEPPESPGHMPVIRGLKIHQKMGEKPCKYWEKWRF